MLCFSQCLHNGSMTEYLFFRRLTRGVYEIYRTHVMHLRIANDKGSTLIVVCLQMATVSLYYHAALGSFLEKIWLILK